MRYAYQESRATLVTDRNNNGIMQAMDLQINLLTMMSKFWSCFLTFKVAAYKAANVWLHLLMWMDEVALCAAKMKRGGKEMLFCWWNYTFGASTSRLENS